MGLTKEDVKDIVKTLLVNNQRALQGYAIASLYFKIGEFRTAQKYVSNYLKIRPNCFVACKLQGECNEKLSRADDALESYQKAINSVNRKTYAKCHDMNRNFEEIKEKGSSENDESSKSAAVAATSTGENSPSMNYETDTDEVHPSYPTFTQQPPGFYTHSDDSCSEKTFKFAMEHFSTLDCPTTSNQFTFRNFLWRILVLPIRDLGASRTFAIYLQCTSASDSNWSCNVEAEFRLLPVKQNQHPYVKKFRKSFNRDDSSWGFPKFIPWYDVVCPTHSYMHNDCVTVEVHVEVLDSNLD